MASSQSKGSSPTTSAKNIVLFIDGTWNKASDKNITNVRKLFDRAYAYSNAEQVVHYIAGVGTNQEIYAQLPFWVRRAGIPKDPGSVFTRWIRKYAGGAFGYGMPAKVTEAYAFLVAHYNPGDRIYMFGFSRGAYAVRSLTCFIEEVGLLLKEHLSQVEHAYRLYQSGDQEGIQKLRAHVTKLTGVARAGLEGKYVLPVHMMGVWDTVGALKFTQHHRRFRPDETIIDVPGNISHVRHALALHELRPQFEPMFWQSNGSTTQSSLQQVWFAGAHADVGGGYHKAELSDLALEWMANEAKKLGLIVEVRSRNIPAAIAKSEIHNSLSGVFSAVGGTLRKLIDDRETNIYDHDLHSHAVHRSAALRLREKEMPCYGFFCSKTNDLFRCVDEATVELIWALGLKMGRLPLATDSGDELVEWHSKPTPEAAVPDNFKSWTALEISPAEASRLVNEHVVEEKLQAKHFAASIMYHSLLDPNFDLKFVIERVDLLRDRFENAFSSAPPDCCDTRLADEVELMTRELRLAAQLTQQLNTRRMLLALAEHTDISYSVRQHSSASSDRVKRRLMKV